MYVALIALSGEENKASFVEWTAKAVFFKADLKDAKNAIFYKKIDAVYRRRPCFAFILLIIVGAIFLLPYGEQHALQAQCGWNRFEYWRLLTDPRRFKVSIDQVVASPKFPFDDGFSEDRDVLQALSPGIDEVELKCGCV